MENEKVEIYKIAIWLNDVESYHDGGLPLLNKEGRTPLSSARLFDEQRSASLCLSQSRNRIKNSWYHKEEREFHLKRLEAPNMELREIKMTLEVI